MLRLSKTPIMTNLEKKNINQKKLNNDKMLLKKKPYINFNFNLIQNKNLNQNKIRTITPNLRLREIVNKKFRENNFQDLGNLFKLKSEFPAITRNNPNFYTNKSYIHTEYNIKKESIDNIDRQLKLIFVMKNKITELNRIIKEKNQEIMNLKNAALLGNNVDYNTKSQNNNIEKEKEKSIYEERHLKTFNNEIKKEFKNISKDKENNIRKINSIKEYINKNNNYNNNKAKNSKKLTPFNRNNNNEIEKLNKEIQNLNKIVKDLDQKYQQEIAKNKEFKQKYTFIRNCTFGLGHPAIKVEEKIKNYENRIIVLEEQIFQCKEKQRQNKKKIVLTEEEYSNIHLCLNALLKVNNINEEKILKDVDRISFENIEKIANNICDLLKISNNNFISNFINDYIIKNNQNFLQILTFGELFKYNTPNRNYTNNNLFSFLKERCITYDYNKKGKIPIEYLRHIYIEYCYKNEKKQNEKEFFYIVCICKKNSDYDYFNSIYDIYYNNLEINKNEINDENSDYISDFKKEIIVKNFIASIINEEKQKFKERENEGNFSKGQNHKNNNKNIFINGQYSSNEDDILI